MNFFINEAKAEEVGAALDNPVPLNNESVATTATTEVQSKPAQPTMEQNLMSFLPLVIIFTIFYFFLIRPQVKKQKEQQKMVESLKKGDKVVMSSGIAATIVKVEDNKEFLQVEIAPDVKVRVLRSAILQMINNEVKEAKAENKASKAEKLEESTDQ